MRRKRLTSLKETDAFQQPRAWEPSKLSKSRPVGTMSVMESGAHPNQEKAPDKRQTSACNYHQLEMHGVHLPISDYLFVPLLPGLNAVACCSGTPKTMEAAPTIPPGCSYIHELQTQNVDLMCNNVQAGHTCESHNSS